MSNNPLIPPLLSDSQSEDAESEQEPIEAMDEKQINDFVLSITCSHYDPNAPANDISSHRSDKQLYALEKRAAQQARKEYTELLSHGVDDLLENHEIALGENDELPEINLDELSNKQLQEQIEAIQDLIQISSSMVQSLEEQNEALQEALEIVNNQNSEIESNL